jgi:apolipoprotein N-acyltransferase
MNRNKLVALSVTGGVLSGLAFTGWCSGLILLISFVPFLIIENHLFINRKKFSPNAYFTYIIPGFIIFSIIAIGWMRVASMTGAIAVILGLSFLMAFSFWLAHIIRLRSGIFSYHIAVITFWLSYEFISLNVNIVSPWLNLGNGLAKDILFIQWYEITGTSGGTLWILTSNLMLTAFLNTPFQKTRKRSFLIILWILILIIPATLSFLRFSNLKNSTDNPSEVVIIQPNSDPFSLKFSIPFEEQMKDVISMAERSASTKTTWIITPETTVDDPVNLDSLNNNKYVSMLRNLAFRFPGASVVTGMVSYKIYPESDSPPTVSARITDESEKYSDHFNSAFRIDTGLTQQYYHKSKLVPGIEMQFSNGPGRFISRILPFLGGTPWGYGIQKERTCFDHITDSVKVAPVICYESVFGQFVTGYVKNGANALFIITNDGWWKNTNGYKQHLAYASIRAIETRRPVARAANTGVSCIIDIRGKRIAETEWWTKDIIKGDIYPESQITPYVKYGDFLLRISVFISLILLAGIFIIVPLRKKTTFLR